MKVACSTAGFTKLKLEDALKSIKELGFCYTDLLMMENWAHINPSSLVADPVSKAKWAGELLKANDLTAIGINSNVSRPINTTDLEGQRKNLAETEALAIFAENLNIPVVVLQPGPVDPDRGLQKSQEASINALKDMLKLAKKHNRELAIETHVNSVGERYEDALKIVKSVPGLKLAYDPSHFIMQQMKLADSEAMIDYSAHVHLRNAVVGNFQAPMDKGILDFDWVFNALKRHNYDGYIAIEYIDGREDYDINEQITRLKEIIEKA